MLMKSSCMKRRLYIAVTHEREDYVCRSITIALVNVVKVDPLFRI
jgi:hypothetical protein